jgi:hypothetical protein
MSIVAEEGTGIGVIGAATDVFEAPEKGLDAPVVVRCPAAVLVAANFLFEPAHGKANN